MEKTNQAFGERLQALLNQEGLTRNALSTQAKIPYSTLKHSLETPGAMLSIDHILSLSHHFPHWSLRYLLTGEGEPCRALAPPPKAPNILNASERTNHWMQRRAQVQDELGRIRGDAWGPYVLHLQQWVEELIEENNRWRAWLHTRPSDVSAGE